MEKFEQMALLLDIYGELLTKKQKDVMDQYYNYDLSLQEIAENIGISKQGVHDLIKRSEHSLLKTNEKLGMLNRLSRIHTGLEEIKGMLKTLFQEEVCPTNSSDQASEKLDVCLEKLEELINTCLGG